MSKYTEETYKNLKYGNRAMAAISTLFSNEKLMKAMKGKASRLDWALPMAEFEPDAVIELIAAYRKMEPEELAAKMSPMTLPLGMLEVLNDPEWKPLFTSAGQKTDSESSGSRTASTEDRGET